MITAIFRPSPHRRFVCSGSRTKYRSFRGSRRVFGCLHLRLVGIQSSPLGTSHGEGRERW
ncbi:uncharacterized protein BDZ83DRAFT_613248 [Colletotrichum acutatum]|uniref:Uncharacterized protein n=1 Tax=Glomerella acutata TaxID=27357 RepID=A0AAD8UT71_GLOAC|nr:uncharacterized protein BDZ83DRAFT_613248 [Colletotrichum acutatum]KAK1727328.1 hypothetical protein BDZ83DRAFT_613248 [Colletotrichum acutatum]